ncbi:MAG: hypothetical protein NC541_02510 [bacterium]|nr:hypothetical protein [bacterium]
MGIDKYWVQLKEVENKFIDYQQDLDNIIDRAASLIVNTVITKGRIVNPTPYYYERMGDKLNGKILQAPVSSDYCMKYHYDSKNRLIMIEEYSVFLEKFEIAEIYFYNDWTERLRLSSDYLAALSIFDNGFSNTRLCLVYAGCNGYIVEEFVYDKDVLTEIQISRDNNHTEIHKFAYDDRKLIQIERICRNGYKELIYTTKKPNFNKMKEDTYNSIKKLITNYKAEYTSFGIEGFIDQQQPMFCICFTADNQPSDLIADWNTEMYDVWIYDYQFSEPQERKCVKIIAEIIVELVEEGLLKNKQIYFHQSQVCVTQFYSGAKNVFKKANLTVN